MDEEKWLAERFEAERDRLRAVAYRMLGSLADADDAVQEAWLRLSRAGTEDVENLGGWLTTVVARVALDMLRSRKSRREEPLDTAAPTAKTRAPAIDPEAETQLADSIGVALLIVLERLEPAQRIAFVLHDTFGVPFEKIARIVGRSPAAARQLASRARRRVRGTGVAAGADVAGQRKVVEAFIAALRAGDFDGLVAVLDPDVVVRLDPAASAPGAPSELRGAQTWAKGAIAYAQLGRFALPMLVDGAVGLVMAPKGRLFRVLHFTIADGKIIRAEIVADPERLRRLDLAVLPE